MKNVQQKIDVSVALPTWNSSGILWLQLESLCRQKTDYAFEVIVLEDPSDNFAGKDYVMEYSERLQKVGGQLVYISLDKWIPLGLKWKYIAEVARGDVYVIAASDNYSSANRIQISANAMLHSDWFDARSGNFYHIQTGQQAEWNCFDLSQTGLFMATKTSLMKQLDDNPPPRGIDAWIRSCFKSKIYRSSTEFLMGLHTDGYNTLSHQRKHLYFNSNRFRTTTLSCKEIVPSDIYSRLLSMKENKSVVRG